MSFEQIDGKSFHVRDLKNWEAFVQAPKFEGSAERALAFLNNGSTPLSDPLIELLNALIQKPSLGATDADIASFIDGFPVSSVIDRAAKKWNSAILNWMRGKFPLSEKKIAAALEMISRAESPSAYSDSDRTPENDQRIL